MRELLNRPWILLLVCCVPTVLVTALVAYNLGAASVALTSTPAPARAPVAPAPTGSAAGPDAGAQRIVAQSMLPGAQPAATGGIVALVSYAGDIASLPASATVFVFARRAGVPMPVAVEKYQPSQLPVEVVFRAPDETGTPLQVTARLSRSGGVRLEAGDVEASSEPMIPGAQESRVELLIPPL
ncbi:MAG: hypothetical protein OES38_13325 [Gammaproteobacteria bacterium]|nr:hypothetical protein [Gammaproteobacteria bacterium]